MKVLEGEPTKLQCFTCSDEFTDSWSLLLHLSTLHKMVLYKELSTDMNSEKNGSSGDGNVEGDTEAYETTADAEQNEVGPENTNGAEDENNVELKSDNGENLN